MVKRGIDYDESAERGPGEGQWLDSLSSEGGGFGARAVSIFLNFHRALRRRLTDFPALCYHEMPSGRGRSSYCMSAADTHLWGSPQTSSRRRPHPAPAAPYAAPRPVLSSTYNDVKYLSSERPVAFPPGAAADPEGFCHQTHLRIFKRLIDEFDNKAPLWRVVEELNKDSFFFLNFPECWVFVLNKFWGAQRYVDYLEFRSMVMPRSGQVESKPSSSSQALSRVGEGPALPPASALSSSSSSSVGGGAAHSGVVSGIMDVMTASYREKLMAISDDYKVRHDTLAREGAEKVGPLETLGTSSDALLREVEAYLSGKTAARRKAGVEDSLDISNRVQRRMDGPDINEIIRKRLAPLTPQQEAYVRQKIWSGGSGGEVLVKAYSVDMTRDNLRTLKDDTWLNDEVINFFFNLLQTRDEQLCKDNPQRRKSHFFNSFFISKLCGQHGESYQYSNVRRWTRKVDIFELEKIFFPVNLGNTHWCLAVIFMQQKKIQYYDSMNGAGTRFLEGLKRYLADEWADKKKQGSLDLIEWQLVPSQPYTPQQNNSVDCGVFATSFAYLISEDLPINKISQKDMPSFRKRMALSIVKLALDLGTVNV